MIEEVAVVKIASKEYWKVDREREREQYRFGG